MHAHYSAEDIARSLVQARTSRIPVPRPAGLDIALAASIRAATIEQLSRDSPLAAYKVSLSTFTWGALPGDVVVESGTRVSRHAFIDPLVEAEIAFRIDRPIAADTDIAAMLDACSVTTAIEIADSRWEGWRPSAGSAFIAPDAPQIEADNAVGAMLVVGSDWLPARDVPLETLTIAVLQDGRLRSSAPLRAVMGGPAHAAHWLIGALAREGRQVRPGQIISSGCPCREMVTVPPDGGCFEAMVEETGRTCVTFD